MDSDELVHRIRSLAGLLELLDASQGNTILALRYDLVPVVCARAADPDVDARDMALRALAQMTR